MIDNIIDQLKRDEGFRATVYSDSRGFSTIGYGHNLDAHPMPGVTVITELYAETLLRQDLEPITSKLIALLPWTDTLDDVYLGILENMSFNMGVEGLVGFHHMLSYMQMSQWQQAADAMKSSDWYTEVGDRAVRLYAQMVTGEWQ